MKNPNQPPLFGEFADADQVRGFKTKDDREFEHERKRKSRGKREPMPPAPETGPACIRCARWRRPMQGSEYGSCSHLVRLNQRVPRLDLDVGSVIAIAEADRLLISDWEYLRTGGGFSCSSFATEADVLPSAGSDLPRTTLLDRVRKAS